VLAASYDLPSAGAAGATARELAVHVVAPGRPPEVRPPVAQARDDSFGFDVAATRSAAVIVWDEATPTGRGVVRAVDVTPGAAAAAAPAHSVSPPESDAEAPRVLPIAAGFVALWLARAPEVSEHADDHRVAEAPGEERTFGWVEAVALDAHGAAEGPVRRLTSTGGHVSAFDAEVLADGSLLVAARDDGEAVDGSGGVLLRVRESGDRVDPPLALASDGLGRGAPDFVGRGPSGAGWLGWIGPEERPRLMPLDAAGAPSGPASVEDAWAFARPLVALGPSADASTGSARLLVAAPADPASPLRLASCAP
jgi:hypothetical protein